MCYLHPTPYHTPGGTQLWVTAPCATKKTLLFFCSLSPKDPHFYQLSTNDPLFLTNSLSLQDPDISLSLKDPSFLQLIVKQVTIFGKKLDFSKMSTNLTKCWEIFGYFGPESPCFWLHFTERPPTFVRFVTERPPFWGNLSLKDPYIWGAWWHQYVTFISEYPPPPPDRTLKE